MQHDQNHKLHTYRHFKAYDTNSFTSLRKTRSWTQPGQEQHIFGVNPKNNLITLEGRLEKANFHIYQMTLDNQHVGIATILKVKGTIVEQKSSDS